MVGRGSSGGGELAAVGGRARRARLGGGGWRRVVCEAIARVGARGQDGSGGGRVPWSAHRSSGGRGEIRIGTDHLFGDAAGGGAVQAGARLRRRDVGRRRRGGDLRLRFILRLGGFTRRRIRIRRDQPREHRPQVRRGGLGVGGRD